MVSKEIVSIEFRYKSLNKYKDDYYHNSDKLTVGIFDSLEEAVIEGNKVLEKISHYFDDNKQTLNKIERFSLMGFLGRPNKLVTDVGVRHSTGVQMFAKIETLKFSDVEEHLKTCFSKVEEYKNKI